MLLTFASALALAASLASASAVDTSLQNPQFMQPQFTAIAPQFTSFNPYQQQAQQEAMQVRNYTTRCSGLP